MVDSTRVPPLALEHVTGGYDGVPVVADVGLRVERGEVAGVVGPSGAGKTTLLRLVCGQADRYGGSVAVHGEPVGPGRGPRRVGYVPQITSVDWDFPLTVQQAVLTGAAASSHRRPWYSPRERARARDVLDRLGLGGLERRAIRELSGGQRQRMFLARALLRDADLLLLDEPTSGVDVATRAEVLTVVGELAAEGRAVLLTTHDLNWVAARLPRLVCLAGRVIADGAPASVLTPEVLRATYHAELRVVRDGERLAVVDDSPMVAPARETEARPAARHPTSSPGTPWPG